MSKKKILIFSMGRDIHQITANPISNGPPSWKWQLAEVYF